MGHGFVKHRLVLHLAVMDKWFKRVREYKFFRTQERGQHMVVQIKEFTQFAGETLGVLEILHPQRTPRNFVFISRTNASPCGANFFRATLFTGSFACNI